MTGNINDLCKFNTAKDHVNLELQILKIGFNIKYAWNLPQKMKYSGKLRSPHVMEYFIWISLLPTRQHESWCFPTQHTQLHFSICFSENTGYPQAHAASSPQVGPIWTPHQCIACQYKSFPSPGNIHLCNFSDFCRFLYHALDLINAQ